MNKVRFTPNGHHRRSCDARRAPRGDIRNERAAKRCLWPGNVRENVERNPAGASFLIFAPRPKGRGVRSGSFLEVGPRSRGVRFTPQEQPLLARPEILSSRARSGLEIPPQLHFPAVRSLQHLWGALRSPPHRPARATPYPRRRWGVTRSRARPSSIFPLDSFSAARGLTRHRISMRFQYGQR